MTTISKILILAALAGAVEIAVHGRHRLSGLQSQVQALQGNRNPLLEQASKARQELAQVTSNLIVVQQQNERLRSDTRELPGLRGAAPRVRAEAQELVQLKAAIATTPNDPSYEAAVQSWTGRVADLKRQFEQMPDQKIPELRFLTDQDWLKAAKGQLDTDTDYREAMAALREAGEQTFLRRAKDALERYFKDRDPGLVDWSQLRPSDWQERVARQFPTDLSQLQPYFKSPIDAAILQRWEILTGDSLKGLGIHNPAVITQKAAVDEKRDRRWALCLYGWGDARWHAASQ